MGDQLDTIWKNALGAGAQAAAEALGAPKETKGEDKKQQEQAARVNPALYVGAIVAVGLVLVFVMTRRR